MLQLFSGFNSSLSYMGEYWQMRLTWSFPNTALYIIFIWNTIYCIYIDSIYTLQKKYIQYTYRDTCLRHLYNIGLDGGISINRRGLLACWNDFFLPGLPEIHEQGGVHLVTDDMLQKLGIVIGGARTSGRSWLFVSLWDWVQKIEGFGQALLKRKWSEWLFGNLFFSKQWFYRANTPS